MYKNKNILYYISATLVSSYSFHGLLITKITKNLLQSVLAEIFHFKNLVP